MVGETSEISQSEGVYDSGLRRNDGGAADDGGVVNDGGAVDDGSVDSDLHRKDGGLL